MARSVMLSMFNCIISNEYIYDVEQVESMHWIAFISISHKNSSTNPKIVQ